MPRDPDSCRGRALLLDQRPSGLPPLAGLVCAMRAMVTLDNLVPIARQGLASPDGSFKCLPHQMER